ncbi:unnamed protein product, partial [Iphiclides podalirius]
MKKAKYSGALQQLIRSTCVAADTAGESKRSLSAAVFRELSKQLAWRCTGRVGEPLKGPLASLRLTWRAGG